MRISALLLSLGLFAFPALAADKPNIIYILVDDAGYGDFSVNGQKKFGTPHIDRLAKEGIRFTDHYSGSTVCAPTRCSIMTGLHTGHAFVRGNREVKPEGQAPMPADIVTIPRLLSEAGYTTGAFGKWGMGAPGSESDPMEHFDRFFGYNCQRQAHNFYPTHLWSDREKVEYPDRDVYSHDEIMREALSFVRAQKENPFFIYLAITIPHAAMQVPEDYARPWREKFPQFNEKVGKYGGSLVKNPVANFPAMMTKLDDGVGELLALLEELKIDEKTLVLFTSDNGPHKEGGHDPDFWDSNGPLKGYKRDLYEGGIRVPLFVRWPGTVAAGQVNDHLSAHWDMMPTFCELAGVSPAGNTDGISMVPTLLGNGEQEIHDYLYWEFYERGGRRAARFGNLKAVQYDMSKNPDAPIELYDLEKDIGEENDLAASLPEVVDRARKIFAEAHTDSPNWLFKYQQEER